MAKRWWPPSPPPPPPPRPPQATTPRGPRARHPPARSPRAAHTPSLHSPHPLAPPYTPAPGPRSAGRVLAPAPLRLPAAERPAHPQKPASERRVNLSAARHWWKPPSRWLPGRPLHRLSLFPGRVRLRLASWAGWEARVEKSRSKFGERERRAPQTSLPVSEEEAREKDAASGEHPGCETELPLRELEVCDAPGKGRSACGWAALG